MTLSLAALLGDYNRDGSVDAADYVVWRNTDINGQQGYDDWRENLGSTAPSFGLAIGVESLTAQIPEPATWASGLIAMVGVALRRKRHAA